MPLLSQGYVFVLLLLTTGLIGVLRLTNGSLNTAHHAYHDGPAWHAPKPTEVDDLTNIMNKDGIYGFIFNSSVTPAGLPYSTYNWCNMPHVRAQEYPRANDSFTLRYVEVIHRHHKRTPYADNTFPIEVQGWNCSDEGLIYSADHVPSTGDSAARTYWRGYTSSINPFCAPGFAGDCSFPQITSEGLSDCRQHGRDLGSVYVDLLGFLPPVYNETLASFRVTNNHITSQVASQVVPGLYPELASERVPLLVQAAAVDSLEPRYACPAATYMLTYLMTGGLWRKHLAESESLFAELDQISGVSRDDAAWHTSWDHYFDNLSARLCHGRSLPCSASNESLCVSASQANAVFRLGEWEYSFLHRGGGAKTLAMAAASYGVFAAEVAANLRAAAAGDTTIKYRHNVAHDGSISKLLALLQIESMVWPGMGAEVVFELHRRDLDDQFFIRVLWSGQVLKSSNPTLGVMDMVPLERFLGYIDGLTGFGAAKVADMCKVA